MHELLNKLAELNVKIGVKENQLLIDAPAGVLTDELRESLRAHKQALITLLSQSSGRSTVDISLPQIVPDILNRYQAFPLNDIQHAYWMGRNHRIELGNVATHFYFEVDAQDLDINRFNQALCRVIEHHDMLRAVLDADGQQRIQKSVNPYKIAQRDLSHCTTEEKEIQLSAIRAKMSHQVLPTDQWPLFEVRATLLSNTTTRLHFSWDFIIVDAWSMFIIFRQWHDLYRNPALVLPKISISYRDYVLAERKLKESEFYARAHDYWWQRIDTLPAAPMLPVKSQLDRDRKHPFVRRQFRLDAPRWQAIKSKTQAMGITPSNILLSAFAEVLTYWSKRPHYTLNLTLFNRLPLHDEVDQLVGDFTSLSLVEIDHRTGGTSFSDRALAIQQQFFKDLEHRQLSGVEVLREWSKRRGYTFKAAMPVVFTSSLVVASRGQDDAGVLEKWGTMIYGITQTPQVWLDHQVFEQQGELVFNWDAVEEVFAAGVLDTMFDRYCRLLENLATSSDYWLRTSVVMLPPEQQAQRQRINDTAADRSDELLHTLFIQQALKNPQAIAIVSNEGEMCYGELLALSNQLAQRLCEKGVTPNQLIAIVMDKGWQQIVAALGILISGAAYLPIDAGQPKARHHQLFKQSGATIAITQPSLVNHLAWPENVDCLVVDSIYFSSGDIPFLNSAPKTKQQITDLAYVIFTSGSTGVPKGVMIDHRGAVNTVLDINRRFGVGPKDRVLAVSALNFDLSVYDIFGTLAAGGTIIMPSPTGLKEPVHWADLMRQHGGTIWNSVPLLMQMLIDHLDSPPQSLRLVMLSGDWIPLDLPDRVRMLWDDVQLVSLGGATEASIWSIFYPIKKVEPSWKSIPYGKPLTNQQFHVLNEWLEPCPVWVLGQLYIGGIGLAKGYWRDEEKTSASFIIHPRTKERLYKTGDLGRYLPDGNIEFIGREDFQVKIHGYRIELGEIEATLKQLQAVSEAVLSTTADPQGNKQMVAYIVPDPEKGQALFERESVDKAVAETTWTNLVQVGKRQQPPSAETIQRVSAFWRGMEQLSTLSACRALINFGVFVKAGETHSLPELMNQCQIQPRYKKLLGQWLNMLTEDGILQKVGEEMFQNPEILPAGNMDALWQEVRQAWEQKAPELLSYFKRSMDNHIALFKGEEDPLELFFPGGSWDTAESMYQYNPIASHLNSIVREVLKSLAADLPPTQKMRILEVGAGTGGTTASLLPILPPERTVYTYTDLSTFFISNAKEKFCDYPFVEYGFLDIDKDPLLQGYTPSSFEVIVAVNVLHDARNINITLKFLCSLLAPAGRLLILETTQNSRLQMISVGFIEGFSHFEDERLQTNMPLLELAQWRKALLELDGFEKFTAFPEAGTPTEVFGQHVIIAQASTSVDSFNSEKLRDSLYHKLPEYMVPYNYILLNALPLTSTGKIDRNALPSVEKQKKATIVQPGNATESKLLAIWKEVLASDTLGVQHNFFDAGGDSLLLIQVRNQIQQVFGIHLSTTMLFEHTTIRELSHYLTNSVNEKTDFSENRERANKQRAAMMQRHKQIKKGVKNA